MTTFQAEPLAPDAFAPPAPPPPPPNPNLPQDQPRWSPAELHEQIEHDLRVRRRVTERSRDLKKQYHAFDDDDTPLNHPYEWNRTMVSQLVFSRPTCRVTEGGHTSPETEITGISLKNLIARPDWGFVDTFEAIAVDVQFDYGIAMVYIEPTPDWEGSGPIPYWPVIKRISPCMYIRDARTPEFGGKPRHEGHMCIGYKRDLIQQTDASGMPIYDRAVLDELATGDGLSEIRRDLESEGVHLADDSDIVVFWEIYFHDTKTWATIGYGSDKWLRTVPCRAAYGCPAGGPYVMFGDFPSVDQVYPLANLAVARQLVEDINTHRRTIRDDASRAKKLIVVNSGSDQVIQAIQTAPGSSILGVPGFNGTLAQVEIGGPAKESVEYAEFATQKLDRMTGLTEIARGNLASQQTATAVAQAGSFTEATIRRSKSRFLHHTADTLSKVADLIMHCSEVRFPITLEAPDGSQSIRVDVNGGSIDPPTSPWRSRICVEIEPYSQEYVNQTQLRADMTQAFQMALQISQAAAVDPTIIPGPMIDDLFQTLNIPHAARRYFDTMIGDARRKMLEMQMGMQVQQMMTGGIPPQPGQPPGVPSQPPQGKSKPPQRPGNGPGAKNPGLPPNKPGGLVRGQPAPVG